MALEWLNHFVYQSGVWTSGQSLSLENFDEVTFSEAAGRNLRIHETSRSGSVLLSPTGGDLVGIGDAEVFLTVTYAAGGFEYRSAPLQTPVEVNGVRTLRLSTLIPIGNVRCSDVAYTAIVNAHCVFERL